MARRKSTTVAEPTEQVEAPVESTDTEEKVSAEPTTSSDSNGSSEPTEADLAPFKAAAEAAVADRDESTGELPEAAIAKVTEAYRNIDGLKGKNQARSWVKEQMKSGIMSQDIQLARAYVMVNDNLSAGSATKERVPADPTTAFVHKVAALTVAYQLVTSSVPEGVSEDWSEKTDALVSELADQVDSYQAWNDSEDEDAEQPEVSPVVRSAFKLAAGRGSGGGGSRVSGGPRRDIEKHLIQAFENVEVGGFLTVNEIAKSHSTEYGDDRPSAGAVSARLFPKGRDPYNANGISATATEGQSRGATKVG